MKPNNTNKYYKVILNLIQDLQRLSLVLLNNVRGRFQIKSGITTLCTAPISRIETLRDDKGCKGFTLIELLVVVLIIGILAAVALPQYQKAVEKSRATDALVVLESIARAEELYFLANGSYSTNLAELDIDIPGEEIEYLGTGVKTNYFECRGPNDSENPSSASLENVLAACNRSPRGTMYAFVRLINGKIGCRFYSEEGEGICRDYGVKQTTDASLYLPN